MHIFLPEPINFQFELLNWYKQQHQQGQISPPVPRLENSNQRLRVINKNISSQPIYKTNYHTKLLLIKSRITSDQISVCTK